MKNNTYYIVRCDRAGVFFGRIRERSEKEVVMEDVRKLWYWDGACAVEQLAVDGTAKPGECKFTLVVPEMIVMDPVQIIPCSEKAIGSISKVPVWKK